MESVSCERGEPRPESDDGAARKRVAVETYARNEAALRRTARRFSLCEDDADDALQRALEILLRKAPDIASRELVKWLQTVVKHEALAVRRERERLLPAPGGTPADDDWVALLPSKADGPAERVERRETVARSREALQSLKPQELRALTLLAHGYSYAEIGELTSWSQTKVNRCIAEGRERFRRVVSRSSDGSRCGELQPLISAFCDDEAGDEEAAAVREHLRVCAHCRATVRAYRAAPAAAAALAPLLPLRRSLLARAHDAVAELAGRFGGGKAVAAAQVGPGSGAGGLGAAAVAKVAAICIASAGGAAACVATGLVPAPLDLHGGRSGPAAIERQAETAEPGTEGVDYEPPPTAVGPAVEPEPPLAKPKRSHTGIASPSVTEAAPEAGEPASESDAVEYAPPPEPEPAPEPERAPEPAPVEGATSGSPAGEFGP